MLVAEILVTSTYVNYREHPRCLHGTQIELDFAPNPRAFVVVLVFLMLRAKQISILSTDSALCFVVQIITSAVISKPI